MARPLRAHPVATSCRARALEPPRAALLSRRRRRRWTGRYRIWHAYKRSSSVWSGGLRGPGVFSFTELCAFLRICRRWLERWKTDGREASTDLTPPDAVRTGDFRSHQTPDVARVIVRAAGRPPKPGPDLTERERVVPVWMAEGPNKAPIAGRLDVSPSAEHRPERRGSQTHDASNTPRPHPSAGECLSPPLGGGTDWLR